MSNIVRLTEEYKEQLIDFFLKLKEPTYYYWNRFGELYEKARASEVVEVQVGLSIKQEIGFLYLEDNLVKGYCYLRFFPDKQIKRYTTSLGIVVADEFQGQGIGKKLMEYLISYSKKNNYKKIWLATYTDNMKALKLYIRLGFEIEGIFMYDEYIEDKPRHVVSMAKFLDKACLRSYEERLNWIEQIQNH